jgi:hypothetical protein
MPIQVFGFNSVGQLGVGSGKESRLEASGGQVYVTTVRWLRLVYLCNWVRCYQSRSHGGISEMMVQYA